MAQSPRESTRWRDRGTVGLGGLHVEFKYQWDIQEEMWSKKLSAGWSSDRKSQRPGSSLSCLHCWGPTEMPRGSVVDSRMERPQVMLTGLRRSGQRGTWEVRTSREKNRNEDEAGRENSEWVWVGRGES